MTPKEYKDKVFQAEATGQPVFLTESEIRWLRDYMLPMAELLNAQNTQGLLSTADKYDLINAVSIGVKCANIFIETD